MGRDKKQPSDRRFNLGEKVVHRLTREEALVVGYGVADGVMFVSTGMGAGKHMTCYQHEFEKAPSPRGRLHDHAIDLDETNRDDVIKSVIHLSCFALEWTKGCADVWVSDRVAARFEKSLDVKLPFTVAYGGLFFRIYRDPCLQGPATFYAGERTP